MSWWNCIITAEECIRASKQLKNGRSVGPDGLQAEHLRRASDEFFVYVAALCTGMLKRGCVPDKLRKTIIVPIVKDQAGSRNEADNYIGIAISSTLGKMIEKIVANKFQWLWHTAIQQFGFKTAHGCDMYGLVVKETVCHYLENGNECMFGCCLDLSKAYDRVSHPKLFMKLLDRGAHVYLVVLLRNGTNCRRWLFDGTQ